MEMFQSVVSAKSAARKLAEGQTRGGLEKKRKDEKPLPEPEPQSYSPYQQNLYVQSQAQQLQQPTYSGPSFQQTQQQPQQFQQPVYSGSSSHNTPYQLQQTQQPPYPNHQSQYQAQNSGGYGSQTQGQGGYGAQFQGYNMASHGPQSQYGQQQTSQNQGYPGGQPYSSGTRDGYSSSHSVPQSQGPYPPPPLSRAATTGSYMTAPLPGDAQVCQHGVDLYYYCPQCPPRRYS